MRQWPWDELQTAVVPGGAGAVAKPVEVAAISVPHSKQLKPGLEQK